MRLDDDDEQVHTRVTHQSLISGERITFEESTNSDLESHNNNLDYTEFRANIKPHVPDQVRLTRTSKALSWEERPAQNTVYD